MRRIICTLIVMLFFISCGSSSPNVLIVGKWQTSKDDVKYNILTFFKDGTASLQQFDSKTNVPDPLRNAEYKMIHDGKNVELTLDNSGGTTASITLDLELLKLDNDSLVINDLSVNGAAPQSYYRVK
jgi:hypothetical protein